MATLKIIRKRISSVKSTQKITKAMKMVAAAKLRKAVLAVTAARPYADGLKDIIQSIAAKGDVSHPLFEARENPKKVKFLLFTSNKGLCGGFNSNLLRRIETFLNGIKGNYEVVDISVIGKKGRDFYRARNKETHEFFGSFADKMTFDETTELAGKLISEFTEAQYDEIYLVYNKFISALNLEVQIEKLIPFSFGKKEEVADKGNVAKTLIDYIYEPGRQEVLDFVVPKFVASQIFRAHLESLASELGSRMTAMESATKNAKEMIGSLTLEYNRARQATITKELMDIVNGAESIK